MDLIERSQAVNLILDAAKQYRVYRQIFTADALESIGVRVSLVLVADTVKETAMRLDFEDGEPYRDEDYDYVFVCGNCGQKVLGLPHYCPECGCKVDAEASSKRPD